ncbi:MAG TPA: zinc-ribbon domain-containing protein [Ktedonobacteraceae bacterium]|nr:zinc-ribbon domain-containing protein [Ktedonobacteraceae bacterium]
MQCSRCGTPVQQGMAFCPNCGTPYTPAQMASGGAPASSPQYDPTVAAPRPYDPTVAVPPPYAGQGFQPPLNPAPGGYNAQAGYGTPPPPPNAYVPPYAPPPGAFMPPNQPPQKKGPNVGLIIGIVALLIVLIGGGLLAVKAFSHPQGQTNSPTPGASSTTNATTPASSPTTAVTASPATNQGPSPSGSPIDTTAASIITNVQTASAIDSNYLPTHTTNQFNVGNVVYVTFHLNLTASGYVQAKVYADNVYATQSSLTVTVGKYDHGYFQIIYHKASAGAFELYWCLQSDCSDAALAAVASFTVS